jgi:RNA polymerase sigma-70 factor (ECF subfamily)
LAREPGTDVTPDVAARSEAAEQMRSVLKRIATLPRQQQDVVALCVWSGLSYEEAAAALGVPVGTVRSRLSRARASLDSPLAELDGSPRHKQVEMEPERIAER